MSWILSWGFQDPNNKLRYFAIPSNTHTEGVYELFEVKNFVENVALVNFLYTSVDGRT